MTAVELSAALQGLGEPIPDAAHAVSVSLPSWSSNVGYEEGEDWVLKKMRNGYPRFFIHLSIVAFQEELLRHLGVPDEQALLFPSTIIAQRCVEFIEQMSDEQSNESGPQCRVIELLPNTTISNLDSGTNNVLKSAISIVIFNKSHTAVARKFWQHTGDGVSSRRAEFFHSAYKDGLLTPKEVVEPGLYSKTSLMKGPRRYRRADRSIGETELPGSNETEPPESHAWEGADYTKFVEERFGRNLDLSLAAKAKLAIRRRIAGSLLSDADPENILSVPKEDRPIRDTQGFSEEQVYLFPTGMSAIYNTHRMILGLRGNMKSVMFGFPYTDTLKVLEKFGPGAIFYGNGSEEDLDDLEQRCQSGERILSLFCEFPGNPLLKTPNLRRIRQLADKYNFVVVVDETIGNFLNVNVLPAADVVVSSLTKVFSGHSNVMGGSMILNPKSRFFIGIADTVGLQYVDYLWPEDAIYLERNSRDYVARNNRINANAESIALILSRSNKIKKVNYPKINETRHNFDEFRNPNGGYSGLLSVTFHSKSDAIAFYDALATAKGPSLGTNFTLSSPFVILAHYYELEWVKEFGVEPELVRVSVGLEPTDQLIKVFQEALNAITRKTSSFS